MGFLEVGHKMPYYTLYIKSGFSKNLHVIWPEEQFKISPFFLKHSFIPHTFLDFVLLNVTVA